MNKYLAKRIELAKELEKEFRQRGYEVFAKMEIANELDYLICDDYADLEIELTDSQQEELIDIAYNFYMDSESDENFYKHTKAVLTTVADFKTFEDFLNELNTNYPEIQDKFLWNL